MVSKVKMANRSFVIALASLALTLLLVVAISTRGTPVVIEMNLDKLPMEISGLRGSEDSFPESVYQALNADKHIFRHYRGQNGEQVDLYIGYYGTAKGGRTAHNPIGCLPGQGWGLLESKEIILKPQYHPDGVPVNYLLSSKGDTVITTIHWYQSAGTKVISSGIRHNVQRFFGMVFHNRNDGAFVRVTIVSNREDVGAARAVAESFSLQVLNLLPRFWPVEG